MAIRQYIGARYVTKIYENTLDPSSAEWESGVTYEPLTMVTYNNSSYISRKDVPGNIGDPASNGSYWAVTGLYNGQIATLQSEIDDLSAALGDLAFNVKNVTGNMIVVSDSYGTNLPDGTTTFPDLMRTYGGYSADELISCAYDASGFIKNIGNGRFIDRFTTFTESQTDEVKNGIKTILIAAGRNDYEYTHDQILAAIETFVDYCKANYPNARIRMAFIANSDNSTAGTRSQLYTVYTAYADCQLVGADYIAGGEAILKLNDCMASDFIHPSDRGRSELAKYLLQGLLNGKISVRYGAVVQTFNYTNAGVTAHAEAGDKFTAWMEDNIIYIESRYLGLINLSSGTLTLSAGNYSSPLTLGKINPGLINYPTAYIKLPIQDFIFIPYGGGSPIVDVCAELRITPDGDLVLDAYSLSQSGSVGQILLKSSSITSYSAAYD